MTHPQFRKFKIDWEVFKNITSIPPDQFASQLYSACDETVQTSIINSFTNFFTQSEEELLKSIESIVTKSSNPSVHRMSFSNLTQFESESIKDYVVRLKSAAIDCEYSCFNCQQDLTSEHVKDQFIRGISNDSLQTDILAKASHLKTLEDIIHHAEAYETALRDQSKLNEPADVFAARTSAYKKLKSAEKKISMQKSNRPCSGCGSLNHGSYD